jgi:hypothetical protein
MGRSQPWQDTLDASAGTREMGATAIIDYVAPLMDYLRQHNADRCCGRQGARFGVRRRGACFD